MYRVAARTLRSAGRDAEAEDVVMNAMVSLMENPPQGVRNWEAMMVRVTRLRALDHLKSAAVKHATADSGSSTVTVQGRPQSKTT